MSLNAILSAATSGLQSNQTALKVTSNNIANVNTQGYHRRIVDFGPRLTGSSLSGVTIEQVRRIADQYLARESTAAAGALGAANTSSAYFDRIQDLIGSLDGGSSLDARISSAMSALTQLSVDPSSVTRRNSSLSSITSALTAISGMAQNVQSLRQDANAQISTNIGTVNGLIAKVYDLNKSIKAAIARGETDTGLLDQRDTAISDLSKFIDIRTYEQGDGRVYVSMGDGTSLISDISTELRYQGPTGVSTATSFPSILLQRINPEGNQDLGPPMAFESRLRSGEMRSLIDMRDKQLPDLGEQLGLVGASLTEQLNAIHNDSSSVPPPTSMTGRNTGLLATDALNFTGRSTVAVVDNTGKLVASVDLDLSTISTVGDLVSAINSGLGGAATASFSNGVLSLSATGTNGVAFQQNETTPASRGGRGLAQFFGMNDLITSTSPSSFATGVAGAQTHGFTAGGQTDFTLRATDGSIIRKFSITMGGSSFNDIVSNLNTQAGGAATFSLDANGKLVMTPSASTPNARLEVTNDTTARGATGISLTQFFGMGTAMRQNQALNLAVRSDINVNSSKMALARLDLSPTTAVGDTVLGISDNRGALRLAAVANNSFTWPQSGQLASGSMSIAEYVSQFVGAQADMANAAESERVYRQDVSEEVNARRTAAEGVNLDEELSNMMVFQQAYNASARLMTTVQQMYETLLNVI